MLLVTAQQTAVLQHHVDLMQLGVVFCLQTRDLCSCTPCMRSASSGHDDILWTRTHSSGFAEDVSHLRSVWRQSRGTPSLASRNGTDPRCHAPAASSFPAAASSFFPTGGGRPPVTQQQGNNPVDISYRRVNRAAILLEEPAF